MPPALLYAPARRLLLSASVKVIGSSPLQGCLKVPGVTARSRPHCLPGTPRAGAGGHLPADGDSGFRLTNCQRPRRVPPLQCSSRTPLRLFALLPFPCIHSGACTGLIPWQGEPEGGSCFRRTLHARLPTMLRDEAATNMESHAQADPGPFLGLCTGGATRVPWSRMGLPFERLPP